MRMMHEQELPGGGEDMSSDRQDVFRQLEQRHDAAFVQGIRDRVDVSNIREVQYLEMKQMYEILARYRGRVRNMIQFYRQWKAGYDREQDELEKVYLAYEGVFIRKQLHDAWQLYVTVNKDYHDMRHTYLANLSQNPHWYSRA